MVEPNLSPALPQLARYALLVDAGYLYASAAQLLLGAGSRREYRVEAEKLIDSLQQRAAEQFRGELLRTYWYDAARNRVPTIDQRVIAPLPWVKLRLGNLNAQGEQKGVDAQIRVDLEALARHRAVTDAVLLSGDEDAISAVEAAQTYGVRVHLWGVEPPFGTNQAERLVWEADTSDVLAADFLRPYFASHRPPAAPEATPAAGERTAPSPLEIAGRAQHKTRVSGSSGASGVSGGSAVAGIHAAHGTPSPAHKPVPDSERVQEVGEHVAQKWILTRGQDNIRDLLPGPILPPVIDKELLVEGEKELGHSLRPHQQAREWLRNGFWVRVYREFELGFGTSAETPKTP